MAAKTSEMVHGEAVETPSPPSEKYDAYHAEIGHPGRVDGLRIDGDDLDHEHEPKVSKAVCNGSDSAVLTCPPDDLEAIHELGGYGLVVDRQSNSSLSLWYAPVQENAEMNSDHTVITGSIPPYIYQDIGGVDRWIWFVSGDTDIINMNILTV